MSQSSSGKKLLLATHNEGKLRELSALLAPLGFEVLSAADFDLPEPEETEDSFEGNALLKARAACAHSGVASLADDSGLCVNALDGAPGVYSARYAGPERDFPAAMKKLHEALGETEDRSAYFACCLAFCLPDGTHHIFEGRCEGEIIWPPRGADGFGYDPCFVPDGESRTFAEMDRAEKQSMSHRARALQKLLAFLQAT